MGQPRARPARRSPSRRLAGHRPRIPGRAPSALQRQHRRAPPRRAMHPVRHAVDRTAARARLPGSLSPWRAGRPRDGGHHARRERLQGHRRGPRRRPRRAPRRGSRSRGSRLRAVRPELDVPAPAGPTTTLAPPGAGGIGEQRRPIRESVRAHGRLRPRPRRGQARCEQRTTQVSSRGRRDTSATLAPEGDPHRCRVNHRGAGDKRGGGRRRRRGRREREKQPQGDGPRGPVRAAASQHRQQAEVR